MSVPSWMRSTAAVLGVAVLWAWDASELAAQATGTVTGTVRDAATRRALEAVQIYIEGTGVGALTNAAGRYLLLNVPAGQAVVVAELVGYRSVSQTVTVTAGQSTVVDFALPVSAVALDEIVVTGTGVAVEKRKLGNTIATLDALRLENAPVADLSQMIAGREPGVVVLPSSGYTGEGARIRIRGSASLSQLNEPIVYVDGVRVNRDAVGPFTGGQGQASRLDDIPPDAIERVEILKGAAAATLYGTEASNGVIQIFTKKGRVGAPRFSVETGWTAIRVPTNRMEPVADFAMSAADQERIKARWGRDVQLYEVFEEDILPQLLTTGFAQDYAVSVSGGAELFQYFASGRFYDEDGPYNAGKNFPPREGLELETDTNRRFSTVMNLGIIPSSRFRIGISTLYTELQQRTPDNANNIYGVFSSALMSQLRLATPQEGVDRPNYYGQPAFATLRENMYQQNRVDAKHFAGTLNLSYTPTESFRLDGTFGVDFTSDDQVYFRPYRWNVDGFSGSTPDGSRAVVEARSREVTFDVKGSYVRRLFADRLENTFLFGGQGFLRQNQSAGGSGQDFPGPGLATLSALANQSSFESWLRVTQIGGYLQDQIGWNDWIFLTLGGRWDANSAFGKEFNTAFYPKVSFSLVPSQGLAWRSETFSTLRFRGALGESGLQPGAFDKFTTFSPQRSEEGPGVRPDNLGNDKLKPEVSREWELGAEVGLFSDRAGVDVTYWNRTVRDGLVARQFPVTGGFVATQLDNIGEMKAWGLELNVRGTVLQREGLSLSLFANGAFLREKITDMGGAPPLKTGGAYPRYRNYLLEGYAPGSFFGAKLADVAIPLNLDGTCTEPTREKALAYFSTPRNPSAFKPLVVGNSALGKPDGTLASHNCGRGSQDSYLGKPTPDWQGSFGFNLTFARNFELSSLFEYKAGNYFVQDLSGQFRRANPVIGRNTPKAARLEATMLNPASTPEQRLEAAIQWAREIESLSPMEGLNGVFDASFIRWRELSLSYRVPVSLVERFGLSSATVVLGARNLALIMPWSDYPGMDPEGNVTGRCNGGLDCNFLDSTEGWGIPLPRRFTLTTRVTF